MANLLSVLKYEGPNDVFVWKHPTEDFNVKTQLIVHDTQEAVFFKDGRALDSFGGGRHTLNTDNIPVLKKLFALGTGGQNAFHCEVYYVNKVTSMNIPWGTESPMDMEDPKYGIFVKVRANGRMSIRVSDARRLLLTLVGTVPSFDTTTVLQYFKGVMLSKIKNRIAGVMIDKGVGFLEISAMLGEISNALYTELKESFTDYGLELVNFYVNSISVPDEDFARLKAIKEEAAITRTQADAEAYKTVRMGEAVAQARRAQGFTYQDERAFDVLQGAAENEGSMQSSMMGMGMGLGVGFGLGNPMGRAFGNLAQTYMPGVAATAAGQNAAEDKGVAGKGGNGGNGATVCPKCGAQLRAGAKFCSECGSAVAAEKFCPACGAKQNANAKFCSECGEKL